MSYTTELEVVNACIATLGEQPLNSLTDEHVFKQSALNYLKGANLAIQKRALWFNTEVITLTPDATAQYIYVPQDTIQVQRIPGVTQYAFAHRGRRLYNTQANTFQWPGKITVQLTRLLPFDDCPYFAQDCIALTAVLRFQREFDGDGARYNQLNADRGRADVELMAQHIREVGPNLLQTASNQIKMSRIRPEYGVNNSYFIGGQRW